MGQRSFPDGNAVRHASADDGGPASEGSDPLRLGGDAAWRASAAGAALEGSVSWRSFRGRNGSDEHFILAKTSACGSPARQVAQLMRSYDEARQTLGLPPESAVFRRFFVGDVGPQHRIVLQSAATDSRSEGPVATSIVRQPPVGDADMALLAYHVDAKTPITKHRLSPSHIMYEHDGLRHLWSAHLSSRRCSAVAAQTNDIFAQLNSALALCGGSLLDNCVRTWIYVKDIDQNYKAMVEARTELFRQAGLTANTHYIASTGIEGEGVHPNDLVMMDAYSVIGLSPGQVSFLNDFSRLCATKDYGVTFERGARIRYRDRAHCFVSGTASIDNRGKIVHEGDVLRQLERVIGNIEALLGSAKASLADIMYILAYVRDPGDSHAVGEFLRKQFPQAPAVILNAAVCRPGWLVELECLAISPETVSALPMF